MIIFYILKTGEIVGTVDGRVHDKNEIKNLMVKPLKMKVSEIGKYVVPFKQKYRIEEVDIKEMRIVDKTTLRVEEVIVGRKKAKVPAGMVPDVDFADLILDFESGKKSIYNYKIVLNKYNVTKLVKTI